MFDELVSGKQTNAKEMWSSSELCRTFSSLLLGFYFMVAKSPSYGLWAHTYVRTQNEAAKANTKRIAKSQNKSTETIIMLELRLGGVYVAWNLCCTLCCVSFSFTSSNHRTRIVHGIEWNTCRTTEISNTRSLADGTHGHCAWFLSYARGTLPYHIVMLTWSQRQTRTIRLCLVTIDSERSTR